jgi:hypothetical protein
VVDAINRTDLDLRKSLFGNIVLSGGSTLTKGFAGRLLTEVQRLAVKDMRIKIFAPPERKYSTWIGGSILAGLSTFKKVRVAYEAWKRKANVICRCGSVSTIGMRIRTLYTPNLHDHLTYYANVRICDILASTHLSVRRHDESLLYPMSAKMATQKWPRTVLSQHIGAFSGKSLPINIHCTLLILILLIAQMPTKSKCDGVPEEI